LHLITLNETHKHTHTHTHIHSVGRLWTREQPVTETSTRQHTSFIKDSHAPGENQALKLSTQAAV